MVPFFTSYSMLGFQRTGDLIWALADAPGRGFLAGATAGRTNLAGGRAAAPRRDITAAALTVWSCRASDPAFPYEPPPSQRSGSSPR